MAPYRAKVCQASEITEAVADFWFERFSLEEELIGAMIRNPAAGVETAEAAGVHAELFADETHRLMFLAMRLKHSNRTFSGNADADRVATLQLVRQCLVGQNEWNNESDPLRLVAIAHSHFAYLPAAVRRAAHQLIAIDAALSELAHINERQRFLLSGGFRRRPHDER